MNCAVITPIGPGHKQLFEECKQSVQSAIYHSSGPFHNIRMIIIDDTKGEIGRSAARNRGVKNANEQNIEWLFFLDADDIIHHHAFKLAADYINSYDAIWGNIVELQPNTTTAILRVPQVITMKSIKELLLFDPFITLQMGHFVRTDIALQNKFDESMDTGEDFDYYLRIWKNFRCIKISDPLFINRRGFHSKGQRSAGGPSDGAGNWLPCAATLIVPGRYADCPAVRI